MRTNLLDKEYSGDFMKFTNVRAGKPTIFSGGMKARSRKQPQNI
jgi:hypothetical protein